eukprot:2222106-Rhodomonas_salina.2
MASYSRARHCAPLRRVPSAPSAPTASCHPHPHARHSCPHTLSLSTTHATDHSSVSLTRSKRVSVWV